MNCIIVFNNYIVIRPTTRSYLIGNFGNGNRIKIYTPDKKGKGKWITNCTQNDIGGLHQLPLANIEGEEVPYTIKKLEGEVEQTKKELEEEYGKVSINLADGTYEKIEDKKDA